MSLFLILQIDAEKQQKQMQNSRLNKKKSIVSVRAKLKCCMSPVVKATLEGRAC